MMTPTQLEQFIDAMNVHFGYPRPFMQAYLTQWAIFEGTDAKFNPLASTEPYKDAPNFNSAGVKNYASFDDGVQATIMTLDPAPFGGTDYYPAIRRTLANGVISPDNRARVVNETNTWGTTGFAALIASGWNPDHTPDAPPESPTAPVVEPTVPLPTLADAIQQIANLNQATLIRDNIIAQALLTAFPDLSADVKAALADFADPDYFDKHP